MIDNKGFIKGSVSILDVLKKLGIEGTDSNLVITVSEVDCILAEQAGARAIGILGVSNFPETENGPFIGFAIYLALDNDYEGCNATKKISSLFGRKVYRIKIKVGKDLTYAL